MCGCPLRKSASYARVALSDDEATLEDEASNSDSFDDDDGIDVEGIDVDNVDNIDIEADYREEAEAAVGSTEVEQQVVEG
eukprot:scaffold1130_cov195-Pinguiococcus_pyrenoidosus.AAC.88